MDKNERRIIQPIELTEDESTRLLDIIKNPKEPSDYVINMFNAYQNAKLNESEVLMILETPQRKIAKTGVLNDVFLSKSDRLKHAAEILRSRY